MVIEELRKAIWDDMYQTRFWVSYMELYICRKRRLKYVFGAIVTAISALGILFGCILDKQPWIPIVSFCLLFVLQMVDFLKVPCLVSDNELAKLCRISWLSSRANYKLENLWLSLSCSDCKTIKDAFFKIRNNEILEIKSLSDDILMKYDDSKLEAIAEKETKSYFNRVYKKPNDNNEKD